MREGIVKDLLTFGVKMMGCIVVTALFIIICTLLVTTR